MNNFGMNNFGLNNFDLTSAARAQRILGVWEEEDLSGLQAELMHAQQACAASAGARAEEEERLELLEGIAGQMQQDLVQMPLGNGAADRAATCFRLLEHLAKPATQSEKLSSFPYSRSVRRISACR
jgi:hypothetical protein